MALGNLWGLGIDGVSGLSWDKLCSLFTMDGFPRVLAYIGAKNTSDMKRIQTRFNIADHLETNMIRARGLRQFARHDWIFICRPRCNGAGRILPGLPTHYDWGPRVTLPCLQFRFTLPRPLGESANMCQNPKIVDHSRTPQSGVASGRICLTPRIWVGLGRNYPRCGRRRVFWLVVSIPGYSRHRGIPQTTRAEQARIW